MACLSGADRIFPVRAFLCALLFVTENAKDCGLYFSYGPEVRTLRQTIYVDVLLAVNLFVNYFLLLTVRGFLHIPCRRMRLVLGAAVGAAGSLFIFVPELPAALSVLSKLALSAAVVLAAFMKLHPMQMLRVFVCFYLISFAYAGFMLAVWYFISPERIMIKNSVVYFDVSPLLLALLSVAAYGVVSLLNRFAGQREAAGGFCAVTIRQNGTEVRCTGKIDTGSSLTEPFSRDPAAVVWMSVLEGILPEEIRAFWEHPNGADALECFGKAETPTAHRIRMVPFSDLSGGGVLPAFRPELVIIHRGTRTVEVRDCYIAVCRQPFPGGKFDAILNPALLARGKHYSGKEEGRT